MKKIFKESIRTLLIIAGLFGIVALVSAWTTPTLAPPGGNVPAPVNVGNAGQSKEGGLILNTGGATNGLIVDKGKVGIGTTNPSVDLDVAGRLKTVTIQITGESPAAGKVLTALNSAGSATWQTPSGGGITNSSFQTDTYSAQNSTITMGSADKYFACGLRGWWIKRVGDADNSCKIYQESGSWKLEAMTTKPTAPTACWAYCIRVCTEGNCTSSTWPK